ncbi:MAG TPA: hypothetical protein VHF89_02670 [Solirubrobacteraceae bacterium]|nr:hypothetical protein [Solirubrobacteraceae bacterium]
MPFADRIWLELPRAAGRRSLSLGLLLGDGRYLRAWPPVAQLAPAAAFVVGAFAANGLDQDEIYTYSIATVGVLVAVAALGAALGLWAWLGFVAGDLLVHKPQDGELFAYVLESRLEEVYVPLVVSYALLASLLVLAPLASAGARVIVTALGGPGTPALVVALALHAALLAAFAYLWAQAVAFLIRPVWSYRELDPDLPGIQPLQQDGGVLVRAVVVAMVVRLVLELVARQMRPEAAVPDRELLPTQPPRPAPAWLAIPAKAALLTLLLSGLFDDRGDAWRIGGLIAAILALQTVILPRAGPVVSTIRRVPLVLRVVACVVVAYLLGERIVEPVVAETESFSRLVTAVVLSLAVAAVLLPPERREA